MKTIGWVANDEVWVSPLLLPLPADVKPCGRGRGKQGCKDGMATADRGPFVSLQGCCGCVATMIVIITIGDAEDATIIITIIIIIIISTTIIIIIMLIRSRHHVFV